VPGLPDSASCAFANGVIKEGEDIEADKETIKVSTYKD
jgi:hypothetical protein